MDVVSIILGRRQESRRKGNFMVSKRRTFLVIVNRWIKDVDKDGKEVVEDGVC